MDDSLIPAFGDFYFIGKKNQSPQTISHECTLKPFHERQLQDFDTILETTYEMWQHI